MATRSQQVAAAIDRALRKNHRKTLRRLISKEGADPDAMMFRAIEVSDTETVALLLELGANAGSRGANGASALHWAVDEDRPDLCRVLMASGADPMLLANNELRDFGDLARYSSFQRAVYRYMPDALRFFVIECGIDPAAVRTEDGKAMSDIAPLASRKLLLALQTELLVAHELPGGRCRHP
jgi:hypothetical protein